MTIHNITIRTKIHRILPIICEMLDCKGVRIGRVFVVASVPPGSRFVPKMSGLS